MNETVKRLLGSLVKNIESRSETERLMILGIVLAGMVLSYLSLVFDPMRAEIDRSQAQIATLQRQITSQQTEYAALLQASQEDPNKFANDRLVVIEREQAALDEQIDTMAGDLVTPNQMTQILTTVLQRQSGLELVYFENQDAKALREGVSDSRQLLEEQGALSLDDVNQAEIVGQVYEHGLHIEFQGDFFSTLKYLRFLEEVSGSFFWDAISFRQLEWPNAHISLQIHTLSMDRGFIGA